MATVAPQEDETGTCVRGHAISGLPVKNGVEREARKSSSMMGEVRDTLSADYVRVPSGKSCKKRRLETRAV
jgi:hypothetical protein